MRFGYILCFFFTLSFVYGQKVDNTASYRAIDSEKYFRINYENDLFVSQDKNYTQGYSLELVLPVLSKNPINRLFPYLNNDERKVGIVFESIGFTPDHYEKLEVQVGDRPFAAVVMLKSFSLSKSKASKQRIASSLSFGLIGPAALGKETQTGIHKLTGDKIPYGWVNQIKNQFVLNYGVDYEKELVSIHNYFGINANASAQIGNLYTNTKVGMNTVFGIINNPYERSNPEKVLLYGYIQPQLMLIGFDATLQGGIIGDKSIYSIPSSGINRLVGQLNYGLILQFKFIYLEFSGTNISKEIKTLGPAAWGGLKIGFKL